MPLSPQTLTRTVLSTVLIPASFGLLALRHLIAPAADSPDIDPFEIDLELFSRNDEAEATLA